MRPFPGCIYFIRCREFFKVGHSYNPNTRLISLQPSVPFDLEIVRTFEAERPIELLVHRHLRSLRVNSKNRKGQREWYHDGFLIWQVIETGLIGYNGSWRSFSPRPKGYDLNNQCFIYDNGIKAEETLKDCQFIKTDFSGQ